MDQNFLDQVKSIQHDFHSSLKHLPKKHSSKINFTVHWLLILLTHVNVIRKGLGTRTFVVHLKNLSCSPSSSKQASAEQGWWTSAEISKLCRSALLRNNWYINIIIVMRRTGHIYLSWLSPSFFIWILLFDPQNQDSIIIISFTVETNSSGG